MHCISSPRPIRLNGRRATISCEAVVSTKFLIVHQKRNLLALLLGEARDLA